MNMRSEIVDSLPVAAVSLRVDGARLWQSLMQLAEIGATPKGGVCRLALTDLDRQGRDRVVGWLRGAGADIEVDGAGNIIATRPGRNVGLPTVLTGSHIDTQPSGGKFDGNYGVLAGLEVLRTLNDAGIVTERPVAVAIWTNEEGSRFVPVMGGSGAFTGVFTIEHLLQQRDVDGIAFGEALDRIGYAGSRNPSEGAHSTRISRPTSSKDPSSSARTRSSVWSLARWGYAGMTASGRDRMRMPARPRWNRATMHCAALRGWSRRSTKSQCGMPRMAALPSDSCRSSPIRAM
jgi:Acetylornithine deacetylase/Succinyl-diaminopimelate desuccinylase and related deacylases